MRENRQSQRHRQRRQPLRHRDRRQLRLSAGAVPTGDHSEPRDDEDRERVASVGY